MNCDITYQPREQEDIIYHQIKCINGLNKVPQPQSSREAYSLMKKVTNTIRNESMVNLGNAELVNAPAPVVAPPFVAPPVPAPILVPPMQAPPMQPVPPVAPAPPVAPLPQLNPPALVPPQQPEGEGEPAWNLLPDDIIAQILQNRIQQLEEEIAEADGDELIYLELLLGIMVQHEILFANVVQIDSVLSLNLEAGALYNFFEEQGVIPEDYDQNERLEQAIRDALQDAFDNQ